MTNVPTFLGIQFTMKKDLSTKYYGTRIKVS